MAEYIADILILGSGPAGCTAGIYAARAGFSPLIVAGQSFGGQLVSADIIENYPGFDTPISGVDLIAKMQTQAKNIGVKFINDMIQEVDFLSYPFVCSSNLNSFSAKSIIIATGASTKWLGLKNEQELIGKGVSSCATCDGFFYKGKDIAVIGGGNVAAKEALYLSKLANSVTLIHRRDTLRADKVEQEKLFKNKKIHFEWDSVADEFLIKDDRFELKGLKLRNLKNDELKSLNFDGVFVAIGYTPNTEIFRRYLNLDEKGYIITEKGCCKTNVEGIFAAGDVCNSQFHQAIMAAGSGCLAALQAEQYLSN